MIVPGYAWQRQQESASKVTTATQVGQCCTLGMAKLLFSQVRYDNLLRQSGLVHFMRKLADSALCYQGRLCHPSICESMREFTPPERGRNAEPHADATCSTSRELSFHETLGTLWLWLDLCTADSNPRQSTFCTLILEATWIHIPTVDLAAAHENFTIPYCMSSQQLGTCVTRQC